jgi:L-lysine exporter family protein LysE/ArgO
MAAGKVPMTYAPAFAAGFSLSAALIVAIGAQNAFVLRQGLRREHVASVVLFCVFLDFGLIAAGVTGLGAVLQQLPDLTGVLTAGGIIFLAWFGTCAIRRAVRLPEGLVAARQAEPLSRRAALVRTAGFTLLNPHVYLDTILLIGTIGAAQPPDTRAAFVVGAGLASALWFTALGYGARVLAPLFARPIAWRALDVIIGTTMLAIAAGLAKRMLA